MNSRVVGGTVDMTSDDDMVSFTLSGLDEKDQAKVKDILGGIVEGHVDIGRICRKMSGEVYIADMVAS